MPLPSTLPIVAVSYDDGEAAKELHRYDGAAHLGQV